MFTRLKALIEGAFARISALLDGTITPKQSENLKSWNERQLTPTTSSPMTEQVRTTGGDISLDSSVNALLSSIVATSPKFTPDMLVATARNLLRLQSNGGLAVKGSGNWWYIPVPHLVFAGYGVHGENNGIILTDKDGNCITSATVYYKAFSAGVPTSATDGTAATYSTANGIRFYTTPDEGWLIISGITWAETCAHMAWSITSEYNYYKSPTDANDAGTIVGLTALGTMRMTRTVADRADRTSDTTMLLTTNVGGTTSLTWNDTAEESEGVATGNYIHSANISAMKSDGEAIILLNGATEWQNLTVNGNVVSFTDTNATVASGYEVNYELATPTTASKTVTTSIKVNDMGIDALVGAAGTALITMLYAQGMPDSLAALVAQVNPEQATVIAQAFLELKRDLDSLRKQVKENIGIVNATNYKKDGEDVFALTDGAPTDYPRAVGLIRLDVTNSAIYISKDTTGSTSDWVLIS